MKDVLTEVFTDKSKSITISKSVYDEIKDKSEKNYPREICGMIFDDMSIHHAENVSGIEEVEYRFSPEDFGLFLQYHRGKKNDKKLTIIYHSHPNWKAYPSSVDVRNAWEGYVYLIYSCVEKFARAFVVSIDKEGNKGLKLIRLEIKEE